ncbi:enoyl-CoA hydratase-related protein [Citricoccus muralis]|uniref:Enoyl-CoA hydratase/carnithine racemase n=1 Tax=Citricoccus muralis TaxID=169134 RepID=A0A3D9LCZ0_9MICC|nr:enoyl-CoA hydratase-related protein [Citricoccus muralis]REE04271.1 enoyl-CoA hydratase/carnithine racemase [Citricoccus muralis]
MAQDPMQHTGHETTQDVVVELQDAILTITLNRPAKKNALTDPMYGLLANAIERAESDPDVRVVLLRAEGDLFSAGNDIADFSRLAEQIAGASADQTAPEPSGAATTESTEPTEPGGPASAITGQMNVWRFLHALAACTTPIVAAVQGKAVGVGTTMLLHADYVVLAEGAQLITPFVDLALVPEAASTLLLPQRIGHVRAFAMFALAEPLAAEDAVATGLANRVVPAESLQDTARQVAEALAAKPAGSLTATKRLMRDAAALTRVMDREVAEFTDRLAGPEAREAFAAFAERRSPDFSPFS